MDTKHKDSLEPRKGHRRRNKVLPRGPFDRRTRLGRRVDVLVALFTAHLTGELSPVVMVKIASAAELQALAEHYRASFMRGTATVPLDDLVRLERLARQAVRALGIDDRATAKTTTPTLSDYLAKRSASQGGCRSRCNYIRFWRTDCRRRSTRYRRPPSSPSGFHWIETR
jgi:hypothetical protein